MKDLQHYLQVNYSNFGDYLNSKFEKNFNVECFDEELKEINFIERDSDLFSDIMKDQSFSQNIISDYSKKFSDKLDRQV
ncbi:immunity 22 family protein [Clostridium ljungdahlii]|uniref:immunity 22 family protein n=1 Tax=Clostridium ljungdahlii TaxID=1538 RepID=UPI0038696E34